MEGRILVKPEEGARGNRRDAENRLGEINRANNARVEERLPSIGVSVVGLPRDLPVQAAVNRYENAPGIEYAEPDYLLYPSATFPDDNGFPIQYGLHNTGETGGTPDADIDAPEAWDGGTVGNRDTTVAVIDTGVDISHPDLKNNIWVNEDEIPDNGKDDDDNDYVDDVNGWDFHNDNKTVFDDPQVDEHGTHVAGTVAAEGNNGTGVTGVNWRANVMPLKFVGQGDNPSSDAVEAIIYAVKNGAKISNNSYGYPADHKCLESESLEAAISYAETKGHLFVTSAGNAGTDNDTYPSNYPASYSNSNIISVAATNSSDGLADFPNSGSSSSNYGSTSVDLGAPGEQIVSTVPENPDNNYDYKSGTSMASPHVAGVAALLKSQKPGLGATKLKSLILQSVDRVPALDGKTVTGGRLNAAKAEALIDTDPPDTVTNTNDTGPGSLRAAIAYANDNTGADTIEINATGTAVLESALPELTTDMEIVGPGADQFTVKRSEASGTPDFRIFTVGQGRTVSISRLTATNGAATADCIDSDRCGGGISNFGDLTVTGSTISGNTAESGGGIYNDEGKLTVIGSTISGNTAALGGSIFNSGIGTLVVEDSTISGNTAGDDGGGIYNLDKLTVIGSTVNDNTAGDDGGGILSFGDFGDMQTITNSTISGNTAESRSGGISNNGKLTVEGSTISGNTAGLYSGGISNFGNLTVQRSTISGNKATDQGGGIVNIWGSTLTLTASTVNNNTTKFTGGGIDNSGTLRLIESSVSSNTAEDGGGGIYSFTGSDEKATIKNSTISSNTAKFGGGGISNAGGLTEIQNSTIANNEAPEGEGSGVASNGENDNTTTEIFSSVIAANTNSDVDLVFGDNNTFSSQGYNLIGSGDVTPAFNQTGDQVIGSADPGLGPLADNGGPTKTHALKDASPAIDKGNAGDSGDLSRDQRGKTRPVDLANVSNAQGGDGSDVGSFELQEGGGGGNDDGGCTITGTNGDDTLRGTSGEDVICGLGGNDKLYGLGGDDTIYGQGGNDTIKGGAGTNRLIGNAGNDRLVGGNNVDRIFGQGGDDTIIGLAGDDVIRGGTGTNRLVGRKGDDRIIGGPGVDSMFGQDGADVLIGLGGDDNIRGGNGANRIYGRAGNDLLIGGNDDDKIFGQDGNDTLFGLRGDDLLRGLAGEDALIGRAGSDRLIGGADTDRLLGQDGNDTLSGSGGGDFLTGHSGRDRLFGEAGRDYLNGRDGVERNDYLNGGTSRDRGGADQRDTIVSIP